MSELRSDIYFLKKQDKASIYIKREDLLPFSFGGNKVRIAAELFEDARKKGCDYMISYGSPASNLNRVVSQMASASGMPCAVICKKAAESKERHFNELMVRASGARLVFCERENVRETVEAEMKHALSLGHKPYYVYGNALGMGNEAVALRAYEKAFSEIMEFERRENISFSRIFTATGTGMTQAGLISGCLRSNREDIVTGISVSRTASQAKAEIKRLLEAAGYSGEDIPESEVRDEYLSGGYGKYGPEIKACVKELINSFGIPSDPCYSAKAFVGMKEDIKKREITGAVLFLHTGGTPGFFDCALSGAEGSLWHEGRDQR